MLKEYRTVFREGHYTYEEKRSRFIARVLPVQSEEEAIEYINVSNPSRDARHHCYAYYIEGDAAQELQR